MRSRSSMPGRLASTGEVTGKNSAYPQWMKSLEDKYQKLHTKILQSTSINSSRPPPALRMKRIEASLSRLGHRTPKSTSIKSPTHKKQPARDIESKDIRGGVNKVLENQNVPKSKEENDNLESNSLKSEIVKIGIEITEDDDGDASAEDGENLNISASKGGGDATNYIPTPRQVNTSVSRISYKTSRSCPAAIETPRGFKQSLRTRTADSDRHRKQSNRKNLKLFSRMSMEAQHAVNETLLEMRTEDSSIQPDPSFVTDLTTKIGPSNVSVQDDGQTEVRNPSISSARSCVSGETDIQTSRTKTKKDDNCLFPEITPRSSLLPKSSRLLPKSASVETLDTEEVRIPGIGRYNVLTYREKTFQITFNDFDIRYRDIISCDRRGSETPGEEIREKAIAKCHEWLEKCTPR